MGIRRALGLSPFPRRRRTICVRCNPADAESPNALAADATAPVAYLRTEAMNQFTIEGAPAAGPA
eukprot:CAMPEP_0174848474 /NCGR_PEP_ID=MMETSP1114-20130205/13551_1 /TAXON_ID=312471 /ORGANISM="Neobodo designis, Strain CCAP 1951/1" /LENGTH=64 /DNA_ID=CAMNT_0016082777 /DNA_START=71 /DNA_END=261 /DNA_ORIENTATION=-